jgi:cytoskeletal protein CcmA (bactofilin family)
MKTIKKYALFAAALACLGGVAHARGAQMSHDPVVVGEGQTVSGDIATDKAVTVNGMLQGDIASVGGGSVTVKGGVAGDIVAIGGPVSVAGRVEGDLLNVGGPIVISGVVTGDVVSIGGSVELAGAGQVDGNVSTLGGSVVKSEKAVHKGKVEVVDLRAVRTMLPRVLRVARFATGQDGATSPWLIGSLVGLGLLVFFSVLFTGAILLLLPAVFFPKNVETAAAVITGDMWHACGIGALMVVGFFPGLLMMVVSVLGIPLLPFALMLYAAAGVLGLSAFSAVLQGRFFEGIKKAGPVSLPGKVAAGYALMAGLVLFGKMIPFIGGILALIGFMLLAFGAMLGLGSAFMTRMGSRPHGPAPVPPVQ